MRTAVLRERPAPKQISTPRLMDLEKNSTDVSVQEIDHIGIAVDDINSALPLYQGLLGLELDGVENVEREQVRTARLDAGNITLELLEPLEDNGPIRTFLDRHGPGIHHICFEVNDIDTIVNTFRDAGYELVYETARSGAEAARVNFLHPDDTFGVLLELRETS